MNADTPQERLAALRRAEELIRAEIQATEHDLFIESGERELALQRKLREEMAFLTAVLYPSEEDRAAARERIKANELDAPELGGEAMRGERETLEQKITRIASDPAFIEEGRQLRREMQPSGEELRRVYQ